MKRPNPNNLPTLENEEEVTCWALAASSALQGHAGHPKRVDFAMADADAVVVGLRARIYGPPDEGTPDVPDSAPEVSVADAGTCDTPAAETAPPADPAQ